jgi:hypothetical protein
MKRASLVKGNKSDICKLVDGAKVWWHFAGREECEPRFMRTDKYGAVKMGSEVKRSTTTAYGMCDRMRLMAEELGNLQSRV